MLTRPVQINHHFGFLVLSGTNVTYEIDWSSDLLTWTPVIVTNNPASSNLMIIEPRRHVLRGFYRVFEYPPAPYWGDAIACADFFMNARDFYCDSFNSLDPSRSTGGNYDPSKAGDRGNITALNGLTNALSSSRSIAVLGRVRTKPGAPVEPGIQGSIGSKAWYLAGNFGLEPGYHDATARWMYASNHVPLSEQALTPGSGVVEGTAYTYVLTNGSYQMPALNLGSTNSMLVMGDSTLHIAGDVILAGGARIEIRPTARLRLYVGGTQISIGGGGIENHGIAANFQCYVVASGATLDVGAKPLRGAIYAPGASCTVGTGGSAISEVFGALVAKILTIHGTVRFHYDESLADQ